MPADDSENGYVRYLLWSLDCCLQLAERGPSAVGDAEAHPAVAAVSRLVESHQMLHNMSRDLSRRMIEIGKEGLSPSEDPEAMRLLGIVATMTSVPPWR